MIRFLVYIFFLTGTLYLISWLAKRPMATPSLPKPPNAKPGRWFKPKRNPGEIWVQVYETASVEEGRKLQARLEEEEVECVLYEQGKKDIYGSALKGIGIAVPKTATALAQNIITRLLA